jgi:hypothetical protein
LEGVHGWSWDPYEHEWLRGLDLLRAYASREGHARVPRSHLAPLGHWVDTGRVWRRNGRLSAARQGELEGVPGWVWDPFEHDLHLGLAHLREYIAREGHAMVPDAHVVEGFSLGAWVRKRRTEQREGRLASDRVEVRAGLRGWTTNPRELKSQPGVERLRPSSDETGHTRVPATYVASDGFKLGNWVVNQRQAYRRGDLPRERVAVLETLPDWTWAIRR